MPARCALGALCAFVLLLAPDWGRAAAAPFFGVVPQTPLAAADFARIDQAGLGLRLVVAWPRVEPEPGRYDFAALDRELREAGEADVPVLLQVGGTPTWLSDDPARAPLGRRGLSAWRGFLAELIGRWGPDGMLPRPVRRWQIWNEPNFRIFWRPPSPRAYARLLHASATTIRAADPGATIVAAGVAPVEHQVLPWEFLRRLYRVPGVKGDFDVAALHPYASRLGGVEYELERTRRVMTAAGDGRTPLLLSEVGVASGSRSPSLFDLGRIGQAAYVKTVFARLYAERRRWNLAGAYWFTWRDVRESDPHCVFCEFAGLFDADGEPKPAWAAMRRVVAAAER